MLEAGSGFCFATESLQRRLRGPMSQTDYFESYCAVETFLPGAIHDTLTAATDLFQQFIVAKVGQRLRGVRGFLSIYRPHAIIAAGVTAPGYRWVREEIKACLKQASGAKSFGRVGEDLRSALSTNSEYVAHYRRVVHALPILYCAKFYHTLRSQHSDQMAQLIFDIAGNSNSVADFLSQQDLVTVAKSIEGLPDRILRHTQVCSDLRPRRRSRF